MKKRILITFLVLFFSVKLFSENIVLSIKVDPNFDQPYVLSGKSKSGYHPLPKWNLEFSITPTQEIIDKELEGSYTFIGMKQVVFCYEINEWYAGSPYVNPRLGKATLGPYISIVNNGSQPSLTDAILVDGSVLMRTKKEHRLYVSVAATLLFKRGDSIVEVFGSDDGEYKVEKEYVYISSVSFSDCIKVTASDINIEYHNSKKGQSSSVDYPNDNTIKSRTRFYAHDDSPIALAKDYDELFSAKATGVDNDIKYSTSVEGCSVQWEGHIEAVVDEEYGGWSGINITIPNSGITLKWDEPNYETFASFAIALRRKVVSPTSFLVDINENSYQEFNNSNGNYLEEYWPWDKGWGHNNGYGKMISQIQVSSVNGDSELSIEIENTIKSAYSIKNSNISRRVVLKIKDWTGTCGLPVFSFDHNESKSNDSSNLKD